MKGKYQEFPDEPYDIKVAENLPIDWRNFDRSAPFPYVSQQREGTYHKSNVTLKNGARVYEWMGWID